MLIVLLLVLGLLNAQESIHFRTDAPQGLSVKSSTSTTLTLHYSIQELGIANIDNDKVKGQEIILKGQFAPNAEGRPNLPVVNRYIAVPQGAIVDLKVKENASTIIPDIDLLPAAPLLTDLEEGLPDIRWDANVYGKDAVFPRENFVLSTPTQIRSLDVVLLSITPFRYNPVKRTLEVIYDIDIDIHFDFLSTKDNPSSPFTIFPNPNDGKANLIIGKDLQGRSVVEVYNVLGNCVSHKAFQNWSQNQVVELNLQHLTSGIYIIKLCNDKGCWSQKVSIR